MKKIDINVLRKLSKNLMLEFSVEEEATLLIQLNNSLKQLNLLNNVKNLNEAKSMIHPFDIENNFLREDEVGATLTVEEVLKNAPETKNNQIKVKRVI